MDNFFLNLKGKGDVQLRCALQIVFDHFSPCLGTHFMDSGRTELKLYFGPPTKEKRGQPLALPFPVDVDAATLLVAGWINVCPTENFLEAIDMDGRLEPEGFWIHASDPDVTLPRCLIVHPLWCHYGK